MIDLSHIDLTYTSAAECLLRLYDERVEIEGFQKGVPRWCAGCGDNAVLAALQRLLRDEGLRPEKTMFVSGIGCSSRLPHYMNTYGFHGIHGRALPIAEGIRLARPDLSVFVNSGDGDSFSIGAAHWIHAIRYNMRMVVMVHDNQIYGLTKKQASPTSPRGTRSNTTPRGSYLEGLNPLTVTLGVQNVSFVAQAADWIPEVLYDIIRAAYHHDGLSFIRIVQRCPEWMPDNFEPWLHDPSRVMLLHHPTSLSVSSGMAQIYPNRVEHDPSDLSAAREIASSADPIPIGILYHNPDVPRYEEIVRPEASHSTAAVRRLLDAEFDKFAVSGGDTGTARGGDAS
ncbi:MAG: thiamine pyrophosphate-dependent enzyme [Nocardioidaceae bacterium]